VSLESYIYFLPVFQMRDTVSKRIHL